MQKLPEPRWNETDHKGGTQYMIKVPFQINREVMHWIISGIGKSWLAIQKIIKYTLYTKIIDGLELNVNNKIEGKVG